MAAEREHVARGMLAWMSSVEETAEKLAAVRKNQGGGRSSEPPFERDSLLPL